VPKANLRVAHKLGCPSGNRTSLASVDGCTCKPAYYTFWRDKQGRAVKGKRVHDRRAAERALTALQAQLDAGTLRQAPSRITFNEWSETWSKAHRGKASTRRAFAYTMRVARDTFGYSELRDLDTSDLRRFLQRLDDEARIRSKAEEPKGLTDSTLAKHLRNLRACLQAAVPAYLATNPVDDLHVSIRPRAGGERWDYFTDAELGKLWTQLEKYDAVYVWLCKAAVTTGMRLGELLALRRGDVDLTRREIRVARTYTAGIGGTVPKSGQARVVHLLPDAVRVFRRWFELSGVRGRDALVFPHPKSGSYLDPTTVTGRRLRKAIEAAKIPRTGERGFPRTFHSFRGTCARVVLEQGIPIYWLAGELGHSSIAVTEKSYGGFSKAARRAQAEDVAAGTFSV
jgi:integrase